MVVNLREEEIQKAIWSISDCCRISEDFKERNGHVQTILRTCFYAKDKKLIKRGVAKTKHYIVNFRPSMNHSFVIYIS